MPLEPSYLEYPLRRYGMDNDFYDWSHFFERKPIKWSNGAKIAIWIVTSLEFFPLNPKGVPFKAPGSMVTPYPDYRHYTTRDYGNRVGVFRIMKSLEKFSLRGSYAVNSKVAERYPFLIEEINRRNGEIIAHGVDMDILHYGGQDIEEEREQIQESLKKLREVSGQQISGWLSPAKSESMNTLKLIESENIEYVCDWVNDDLPYKMKVGNLFSMPFSTELSDRQIIMDYKHSEAEYVEQIKDAFDCFYDETEKFGGRVLALSLNPYIIGLPYRIKALEKILQYITDKDGVWSATGSEILNDFKSQF
jgi:allantoinase